MSASKPLEGRVILVTGASRGIGYASAVKMAQQGAHIIAIARTQGGLEDLDDAVKAAGSDATLVPMEAAGQSPQPRSGADSHARQGYARRRRQHAA